MPAAAPTSVWGKVRAYGGRVYRSSVRRDVPILTFHRIRPGDGITEETLNAVLDHVAAQYQVITLKTLIEFLGRHDPLPRDHIVLTFDDSTRDQHTLAVPALRKRGLCATFGVIGCTLLERTLPPLFWYQHLLEQTTLERASFSFPPLVPPIELDLTPAGRDALAGSRSPLRQIIQGCNHELAGELLHVLGDVLGVAPPPVDNLFMTLPELHALVNEGHEAAAHSLHHRDVYEPDRQTWEKELREDRAVMDEAFGARSHSFIYPFGKERRPEVHQKVRQAGFCCAATSEWGTNTRRTSPYALRRVGIDEHTRVPFETIY